MKLSPSHAVRALAVAALVLGGLAVVAGSPRRPGIAPDLAMLASAVENEEDHVTAVELARWIRDRKPHLRIIDVRDSVEFAEYHIPRAERVALGDLTSRRFEPGETVVLYSGGGAHAAQGWVFLRSLGNRDVYFLRGGISEWLDEVMNPRFPVNSSPGDKAEIDSLSALSRYFGGVPRRVDSLDWTRDRTRSDGSASWRAKAARTRGRGC